LRGLKTSGEFEDRIPELEAEMERAERQLPELRKAHEQAIFDGTDSQLKAAEKALQDHAAHLDTLRAALSGLIRRRDEALMAEDDAEWQTRFEQAKLDQAELREINIEGAKAARILADLAQRERRLSRRVKSYNSNAQAAGRSNLLVPPLFRDIADHIHQTHQQQPALFCDALRIPTFWDGQHDGRRTKPAPVEYLGGKTPKSVDVGKD